VVHITFIIVTDNCNQGCIYCSSTEKKVMNEEALEKQIKESKGSIVLTGGEPTLRSDIVKIIKRLKKNGVNYIELQTNGTMLYYPGLVEKLINAGVDQFNVALPSHIEEICDKITKTHGLFDKRLEGIKNLLKFGANVRITMILNTLNKDYLLDYVKFVNEKFHGVKILEINFIKIMGRARENTWLVPKITKIENDLKKCCEFCKKNKINLLVDGIPLCHMKNYEEYSIDAIKFVLKKFAFFEEKEKIYLCSKCSLNSLCKGFRKGYKEIHGIGEYQQSKIPIEYIKNKILGKLL